VTLAQLSVGPLVARDDGERAARHAHLQQAEADFDPVPFDAQAAPCVRPGGRVAAPGSRKSAARAYDAMIAATAVAHDLPVYTCNRRTSRASTGSMSSRYASPTPPSARLAYATPLLVPPAVRTVTCWPAAGRVPSRITLQSTDST
jgi:predicted nucleic acid-binding protein